MATMVLDPMLYPHLYHVAYMATEGCPYLASTDPKYSAADLRELDYRVGQTQFSVLLQYIQSDHSDNPPPLSRKLYMDLDAVLEYGRQG